MEELLACRVCLATDIKLFNIFKCELISAYEIVTGTQITSSDPLPHHMCSYCVALLIKCAAFQNKCRTTQQLLYCFLMQNPLLTMDSIRSIDRSTHNLIHPYTTIQNTVKGENFTFVDDLTNFFNNIIDQKDSIKSENEVSSDEEPLSRIVKSRKLDSTTELQTLEPSYDDINIKEEMDLSVECDDFIDETDEKVVYDNLIDVVTLTKEQQIKDLQARKNSLNYKRSFYKCEQCYKGFMTKATYKSHMDRHSPQYGRFSCDVCQIRWSSKRTLRSHLTTTHLKNYVCRMCGHVSKSVTRAKEHQRWHQGYTYVCDICGATFKKSTSHLTHVRLQHPSGHICEICHCSFISEAGLMLHQKKTHKFVKNGSTKIDPNCTLCGLQFSNMEALEVHLGLAVEGTCNANVSPCVLCGENFVSEELLKEHSKIHQEDTCFECNKKFANARVHATHYQEVHLGIKRKQRPRSITDWVCEICGRQCMSKASLIYHQRTHSGEKPYACSECSKRFSVLQRLQIHMRTHTDERPFKCTHCPKAFRHKAALNRHDRVHTGAKPYACPNCGKTFSQSNSMKTHVRTVHLKLPSLYRRAGKHKDEYSE